MHKRRRDKRNNESVCCEGRDFCYDNGILHKFRYVKGKSPTKVRISSTASFGIWSIGSAIICVRVRRSAGCEALRTFSTYFGE